MRIFRGIHSTALLVTIILACCTLSLAFNVHTSSIHGNGSNLISTRLNRPHSFGARPLMSQLSEDDTLDDIPKSPFDRPVLSLIDFFSIFAFAAVGKASHSADGSLDVMAVAQTAFPFLLSWFVTAPLLGCYTPSATADLKSSVTQTAKGWIVAIPLGCIIRGISKGYIPPLPFVIVTMIATFIILNIGRAGYTALSEMYVEMF